MKFKILDLTILFLVGIFLVGLGINEYETFGLEEPVFDFSSEVKIFFEYLIWPIIALLVLDLALKYREIKDPKKFVKKYWIDIVMLALIPIFSAFKFFKLGLSLVKKLKTAKMGAKIIHKTKKVTKS